MSNELRPKIVDAMKNAMRARDSLALDAVRYLLSLVKNAEIDAHRELDDAEITSLLQKEVKMRREAIQQFEQAGQSTTVEEETKKLDVLLQFLPKQLSAEELRSAVGQIIERAESKDFPAVMRIASAELKGKADGRMVAEEVKRQLA